MTIHGAFAGGAAAKSDFHPIDELSAEHRTIETMLDALEREARQIASGRIPRWSWLRSMVEVLQDFADRCHHGKEEGVLFPELVALGLRLDAGPVAVMKHEHVEARALIQRLLDAVVGRDARETANALRSYGYLLREHILKEDECLFPQARAALPEAAVARLRAGFAQFERDEIGTGVHGRNLERVRRLCAEGGR